MENKLHTQMGLTCAVIMLLTQMAHSVVFFTLEVIAQFKIWAISQMMYSLISLSNISAIYPMMKQLTEETAVVVMEVVQAVVAQAVVAPVEVGVLNLK